MKKLIFAVILLAVVMITTYYYIPHKVIFYIQESAYKLGFSISGYTAWVIASLGITLALLIAVACISYSGKPKTSHGSAHWATKNDIREFLNNAPDYGFALGYFSGNIFRVKSHAVVCAPTGSGKGIGCIIPGLLEYPGSLICLDLKGENYTITQRRRGELGAQVCLVDPFGITGGRASRFNWLDFIETSNPDCVSQSKALAEMIVDDAKADYFNDSAKYLLQGLILHVAAVGTGESRTIGQVRKLLMLPLPQFTELLRDMSQSDQGYGVIANVANQFLATQEQGAGKELSGVINSTKRFTAFLDDPRIVEALSSSDFALGDIKSKNLSIFLVMPPDRLAPYRAFVRVFFSLALSAVGRPGPQPPHKILFIYDEFPQLGYLEQVENAISLMRGYGVQLLLFVQDISQLSAVYPRWKSFIANATRLFYGCSDIDTAKYISSTLGKYTLSTQNRNVSSTGGRSVSTSQMARDLLTPDEVMKLKPTEPIALLQGKPPVKLKRQNYLTDKRFKGLYDKNPYFS